MKLYSIRSINSNRDTGEEEQGGLNLKLSGLALFLILLLIIAITAGICFGISHAVYKNRMERENAYRVLFPSDTDPYKIAKFQDIIDFVGEEFALEYEDDKLIEGAIKAYVDSLGDRYSYYIEPGDYESYNDYITGTYVGLGFTYTRCDEGLHVEEVNAGSPAEESGLVAGQIVTQINGMNTVELEDSNIVSMVNVSGTEIKLTVKSEDGTVQELTAKTATINKQSVYGIGYEDGVYYIRISQFDNDTGTEFEEMLKLAKDSGMTALVLDLRTNGGGYEREADKVADLLLGEGLVAYSQDKNGQRLSEVFSDADQVEVPVVLLVNQNTASASELVTGAFRDFKKGTIVGTKTYGKGIGQVSRSYTDDGSGVVITIATYFTPSGECIHGVGITPDVEVTVAEEYRKLTPDQIPEGEDAQLAKALELIRAEIAG